MYEYTRSTLKDGNLGHNGPYEAMVISHLDRYYQGTLLVELIRHYGSSNVGRRSGQLMAVRYVSPFYGVTPYDGLNENDGYQNTQKSYGFWAVPPDFGTRVLVIFAEGNSSYGYWIGCIQDNNMNFMVPDGKAATTITADDTPETLRGKKLPVGEYNKLLEKELSDSVQTQKVKVESAQTALSENFNQGNLKAYIQESKKLTTLDVLLKKLSKV